MPRKVYTEQFKRDAVAMFESNPDTSMRKVAEELGINRSTLGCWYKQFGTNVAKDEDAASPVEKLADAERIRQLDVMSRDVVLAPARNDTVPIQEVSVQTACH